MDETPENKPELKKEPRAHVTELVFNQMRAMKHQCTQCQCPLDPRFETCPRCGSTEYTDAE